MDNVGRAAQALRDFAWSNYGLDLVEQTLEDPDTTEWVTDLAKQVVRELEGPDPDQVLALSVGDNDAGADTVAEYLAMLLEQVWCDGEGFSPKRPFGNSGWQHELYGALARANMVKHELDEDGDPVDVDTRHADRLIEKAIRRMAHTRKETD